MKSIKDPEKLLSQMTLAEKVGQLNLLHGATMSYASAVRQGLAGSFLVGARPEKGAWSDVLNELQRVAVKESRLGIPLIFSRDVIHGFRTIFPIPLGLAATFEPRNGEVMAKVSANECQRDGIRWTYTPMLDIARDARWGRIAEGSGEDVVLASAFARTIVRGFQGEGDRLTVAACAKHYIGYGAAEGGRDYNSTSIGTHELWNHYLPPFQAAIDAGVATVMAAFNELNGTPMHQHHELLRGTLRERLGFQGVVVSDWNGVKELINHRTVANESEATARAFEAGVDLDMFSECYAKELAALVRSGRISSQILDDSVLRVLRLKEQLGLFDRPYSGTRERWTSLPKTHRRLARRVARESVVLLKNEGGILPLNSKVKKVLVAGPLGSDTESHLGTWSLDGRATDVVSIFQGLREAAPKGVEVQSAGGFADHTLTQAVLSDLVVCVVGEHPTRSGETGSVTSVELPPGQREFVRALTKAGTPVVLVVCAGRPLAIEEEVQGSAAVLYSFHLGTEAGNAIADLIFGRVAPSGRLPVSLPRSTGQLPLYYNAKPTGRPPQRADRFTARYCDSDLGPLFPFGFGLTYGTLTIGGVKLTTKPSRRVTVTIKNSGPHTVLCPVLIFIADKVRSTSPPTRELKRFKRALLKPQSSKTLSIPITNRDLSFISDEVPLLEPGDFTLIVSVGTTAETRLDFSFDG
jgi:beta-glucosidase